MKNKKKMYSFVLAGLAVTQLTGCGKKLEQNENDIVNNTEILTESTEENIETLDDVIVTYSEDGINLTQNGEESVEEIFNIENETTETDSFYITQENVERQIEEYLSQDELERHFNTDLYDLENNDIFWDKAIDVVYQNSQKAPKNFQSLTKDEISYVLSLLKEYCNNLKDTIDMSEVACKLNDLSLYYGFDEVKELFHTAETTSKYIAYYDSNKDIHTFDPTDSTNIHEFFHFLCYGCSCEHDRSKYYANGINLVAPEYSFDNGYKENYEDLNLTGFEYTFIEEASAERMMYTYLGEMPTSYNYYQKVTDNIEFVLSLNDNYQLDSYVNNCLEKQPISFLRAFPVSDYNSQTNFTDNIRMLVVYDALLRYDFNRINTNSKYFGDILDKCNSYDEEIQSTSNLILYSQSQLTKLFFTNLVTLNENHPDKNNLEYYSYLIQIFYGRMNQTNTMFANLWDFDDVKLNEAYDEYFKQMENIYVNYLRTYYQDNNLNLADVQVYGEEYVELPTILKYPEFVPEEKEMFYDTLKNELPNLDLSIARKVSLQK